MKRFLRTGEKHSWRLLLAVLALSVLARPALAIPSPDVMVSFFSNIAQIFGLLTLAIGGALFSQQTRKRLGRRAAAAGGTSRMVLGVICVALFASVAINTLQWANERDATETRLRTNLTRSSIEAGSKVGDTSLKTLSFSQQINHPQGISTADLDTLLATAKPSDGAGAGGVSFIDVREAEELEGGRLGGFIHIPYPELIARAKEAQIAGKKNVLLCHSGNRSSELCAALKKAGIDCRFIVGGFEKWKAEGRGAQIAGSQSTESLRSLPAFPNDDVLLDTPDVQTLVAEENALFVDVRYPDEFKAGHLPSAVNMTLRSMTSVEVDAAFEKLPKRPIIAPCYDKRSCFYSQILGLRLHRRGFDFRGRYTVPHEYFQASAAKPHVQRWLDANNGNVFSIVRRPFDSGLSLALNRTGNMVLAIFLVLAVLRFLLLPFTIKSERDQIVERRIADRISALKEKLRGDPQRLKDAIRKLYRENGLTPTRNVMGLILQLVLLVAFFSAVSAIAQPNSGPFLWIADIGAPDPTFVLPVLLGSLVFLQLRINVVRRTTKLLLFHLGVGVFFIALTATLKSALTLYLILSLALMLLQVVCVRIVMRKSDARGPKPAKSLAPRVELLKNAHRIAGVGTKAQRLAQMIEAGLPVPGGLVVPDAAFATNGSGSTLKEGEAARLNQLRLRQGLSRMAVRSSGLGEDGEDHSYAGVFDSILDVDADSLISAIESVRASLISNDAEMYGNDEPAGGGVIIQELVDADYAGILFTEHPMQSGTLLVEMTDGLGDKLASGTEEPTSFAFGRISRKPLDDATPPMDLKPLIDLGLQVEKLFGQSQDIEWAFKDGRFFLLQARNITVLARTQDDVTPTSIFEAERHRLLEIAQTGDRDGTILAQNELSELLPRPTPMSASFMEALWQPGGSVDLACRKLGVPYTVGEDAPPYTVSVFGGLYVNVPETQRRTSKGLGPLASFRLSRGAETLEQDFRENFLPAYLSDLRILEAMDCKRLPTDDLINLLDDTCDRYFHESHVQVDVINITADFYMRAAERALSKRGLTTGAFLGQGPKTIVHYAMSLLGGPRSDSEKVEEFLSVFGHRAAIDYELALPRYRDDADMMEQLLQTASSMTALDGNSLEAAELPDDATLAIAVSRARKFQNLKEEAKNHSLREISVIRQLLVELDRRLELDGGIFYLEVGELERLRDANAHDDLIALIERRRTAAEHFEAVPPLPTSLTLRQIERLSPTGDSDEDIDASEDLRGVLVAGSVPITGRARVLTSQEIDMVEDGEIAVARYMHPSWTPVFPRLKGIVTEVGGWLSHTSILAREYNINTIVGVKRAEFRINTGDLLQLNLDGTIEVIEHADPPADELTPADDAEGATATIASNVGGQNNV
jgi:YidC/Oxa1 family membrane protein insertase